MLSGISFIIIVFVALAIYFLAVWQIRKWLIKRQVSCFWRSTLLAFFLAPGLLLYGQHGSILPAFAWMSGASNAYNCIEMGLFCDIKLNLFVSILPLLATWIFAYMMCKSPEKEPD